MHTNLGSTGNTRVIGQKALEDFRESLAAKVDDPYQVLLKQNKLPMSLLQDSTKHTRMHILETDSFGNTFGSKAQRKKPKLNIGSMEEMMSQVDDTHGKHFFFQLYMVDLGYKLNVPFFF